MVLNATASTKTNVLLKASAWIIIWSLQLLKCFSIATDVHVDGNTSPNEFPATLTGPSSLLTEVCFLLFANVLIAKIYHPPAQFWPANLTTHSIIPE